jgi:hypothetical protein
LKIDAPAPAPLVRNPARGLWPAKPSGSKPDRGGARLHDVGHRLRRQRVGRHAPAFRDLAEHRSARHAGRVQPGAQRRAQPQAAEDGDLLPHAFLIRLAAVDDDAQPLRRLGQVLDAQRHHRSCPQPAA